MNTISSLVTSLEVELVNLWRNKVPSDEKLITIIVNDFYGLIINLWKESIINDSRLSMDVLTFYYTYKKYQYVFEEESPIFKQLEYLAQKDFEKIINELKKL